MTETNVDSEVIKKTQEMLGKFIKKPPLTEKLLRKPPFKFILDIVKTVSSKQTLHRYFIDLTILAHLEFKKNLYVKKTCSIDFILLNFHPLPS